VRAQAATRATANPGWAVRWSHSTSCSRRIGALTNTPGGGLKGETVRELVGFLGVTASSVFVGFEVRQNTVATRATAYQDMGTSISEVWLETAQDTGRAKSTVAGLGGAELTGCEAQMLSQRIAAYRQYEVVWRQVEWGILEEEVLYYFGWDPSDLANVEWDLIRPFMSDDFAEYLEKATR